jgi:hypothetical protein
MKITADGERFRLYRVRASGKSCLASRPWLPEKHDGSKAGGFRTAPLVHFELGAENDKQRHCACEDALVKQDSLSLARPWQQRQSCWNRAAHAVSD